MDSNKITDAKREKIDFIKKWNINKIKNMTKEEYTSLGGNLRTDFTYDLEHNTPHIGSIKGGDSSKFKLYKTDKKPTNNFI